MTGRQVVVAAGGTSGCRWVDSRSPWLSSPSSALRFELRDAAAGEVRLPTRLMRQ
jgi:hypothetical protein